ncbi:aspartate--tRNA ligase [Candidatus Beckwithbacteria bacterium]|nr:aspartate--tRNA ligase [Candidatus Beckwithbacteria bacterium]
MQRTLVKNSIDLVNQTIKLQGWVDSIRDHGQVIFFELRDRTGKVQVVGDKSLKSISTEDVVEIIGKVAKRPENMINAELATGEIEIQLESFTILNKCGEMPFQINTDGKDINEEIRLKYRYLDLRRARMQQILRLRSQFIEACRQYLFNNDFVEVETPMLTKSTKEGARDFVVPSRFQPGKFYALPQSPQQYKQLLMTAGIENYFQIARCIRDEDLRADRGFEFTQLDLEMSFVKREEVMQMIEAMVKKAVKEVGGKLKDENFPVISYREAMEKYGADRFDLRSEEEKKEGKLAFAWVVDFPFFKQVNKEDAAEVRDSKSGWTFTHNPFSQPKDEFLQDHLQGKNIEKILTTQYDLVCNGYEVGGGSIRAHNSEVLAQTFKIMGYNEQQIKDSVGHMMEAFKLGTPPHGGIALGLDRLIMLLSQENSLKETIAFPMTSSGRTAVMDAPSTLSEEQFKELGLQLRGFGSLNTASILEKIKTFLTQEKIEFHSFTHEPVFTCEQAAKVCNEPLASGAKSLVLKADGKAIMVVVSAADKLDLKTFKKLYNYKDVSMADKQMLKDVTGLESGAVPPFGSLFNIPTYVEENLLKQPEINFNAGTHTDTISIKPSDFAKIEKAEVGNFAK